MMTLTLEARRERQCAYNQVHLAKGDNRQKHNADVMDRQNRRKRELDALKMAMGCVECGWRVHPQGLQFDHIPSRGAKLFSIGSQGSGSLTNLIREIEKCDVVCANCHAIRTAARRVVKSWLT